MGETEESKAVIGNKLVKHGPCNKAMSAVAAATIREIVKTANEKRIRQEDIVSLVKDGSQFMLVYYSE